MSALSKTSKISAITAIVLVSVFIVSFAAHFLYGFIKKSSKIDYSKYAEAESLNYLVKSDWNAQWIWEKSNDGNTHVAFRKTFNLDSAPTEEVFACISADSKYTMWINGNLVVMDGNPKRGLTPTGTYYQEVELPGLKKGQNTISILVWYFGENGYSYNDSGHGGLLFELKIGDQLICSDESFKVKRLKSFVDDDFRLFNQPNYRLSESNIYYDARKDDFSFISENYDDSSWANATKLGKGGVAPWNKLYLSETETISFGEIVPFNNGEEYKNFTPTVRKKIELDIGTAVQFTPYFKLSAKAGKKIRFVTDTFRGNLERGPENVYITKDGVQEFECPYWMSGQKLVLTLPAGATLIEAGYRLSGYACNELTGTFISSDEELNLLWKKSANSVLINMRDTYTDCPDRERAQWLGDSVVSAKIAHYLIGDESYPISGQLYKSLVGWCDNDGVFSTVAPNGIEIFELPCQNLAAIVSMYDYYMYSGDEDTLRLVYPLMKKYLDLWEIKDGIVEHRKGSWDWGDWGGKLDMPVLENAWYYYALEALSKSALHFEDTETYNWAAHMRSVLYDGYNQKFWTGEGYTSKKKYDDRGNAIALLSGLASVDKYPTIVDVLSNVKNSSPYMEKYVDEALFKAGKATIAIERIKERYSEMLDSSCTTLWELWDENLGGINHAWGGGSVILFMEYIAGIKYTGAGYSSYTIAPDLILLDSASTSINTKAGEIKIEWQKTDGNFAVDISAPNGGQIVLPKTSIKLIVNGTLVYENGQYIVNDIVTSDETSDQLIFSL